MKENKTYHDLLFERTDEEKKIMLEYKAENARYENSPAYKEHKAKMDDITERLRIEARKRREEARKHCPSRTPISTPADFDATAFRAKQEAKRKERMASYPKPLADAIALYDSLSKDEQTAFERETFSHRTQYEKLENPQTTKKDMKELLEILVQTTIDFINERGLKDIDTVSFMADSLQDSAKEEEWIPATDASIRLYANEKVTTNNSSFYVLKLIGEYI